jgi:hypothetical protein
MTHRSTIGFLVLAGILPSALAQAASPAGSASASRKVLPIVQDEIETYTVPPGTRILLSLKNEICTRSAMPGDPVYFDIVFPLEWRRNASLVRLCCAMTGARESAIFYCRFRKKLKDSASSWGSSTPAV